MPKLKRTTPCAACPWRVTSLRGYLGSDEPTAFYGRTVGEAAMPCHADIDYEDRDWLTTQFPDAALCAGGLIHMANIAKLPRDPDLAAAVRAVKPSQAVFTHPAQWWAHHAGMSEEDARAQWPQLLDAWRAEMTSRAEREAPDPAGAGTRPSPSDVDNL